MGILKGGEIEEVSQHFLAEFQFGCILIFTLVNSVDSASQLGNESISEDDCSYLGLAGEYGKDVKRLFEDVDWSVGSEAQIDDFC